MQTQKDLETAYANRRAEILQERNIKERKVLEDKKKYLDRIHQLMQQNRECYIQQIEKLNNELYKVKEDLYYKSISPSEENKLFHELEFSKFKTDIENRRLRAKAEMRKVENSLLHSKTMTMEDYTQDLKEISMWAKNELKTAKEIMEDGIDEYKAYKEQQVVNE